MTNHFASNWKIPFVLLFTFTIKATLLYGQIEVEPAITAPFTPESLIENVFLGNGIQITSIRFSGKPEAVGYFSNGMEDIGFEEGILLTTGESWQADRANTSAIAGSPNSSFANSAELERLTTEKLEDVLEYVITFRPSTDSVAFKYRFASEEYPEFGCDCFNDVFAFYIYGSGLDPNGENMAVLPNSNLPVSVKTIHPFDPESTNGAGCMIDLPECVPVNEDLYIDNTGSTTLEYDGFTRTLIAKAKVIPCEEYTLKIAIADVKDDIVDSAVFLEAESFNSKEIKVEAIGVGLDGSIVEGCSFADLVFSIPEAKTTDYTINFTKIGAATPGQDFVDFPNSVTIPAGQLSTTLAIETISDQEAEGLDSIGLAIEIAPCFPPQQIWIPIKDDRLLLPELGEDLTICLGDSIQLMGQANLQSDTIISFIETPLVEIAEVQNNSSNPGNLNPSIFPNTISGLTPATLTEGLLHSICVNISHPRAGDLDIFLQSPSGRFIELSTDNGRLGNDYIQTCFTENATTSIMDGEAPFTGNFLPEGNWERLYGEPLNGTWNLIVRDDEGAGSGNVKGMMLNWSINFNPDYEVEYAWEVSDSMSCQDCLNPLVFPSQATQYTLTAKDNYGCTASDNITINVEQPLVAPVPTCSDVSTSAITISWEAVVGAENYSVNINENGWEAANSGNLQHKITDLQEGESLAVQVRANSNGICASSEELITCETMLCALPPFQLDSTNNVSCTSGLDGKIHISAAADAFFVLGTDTSELGQSAVFDQLPANTYKVLVVAASKLCRDTLTATINEPNNLEVQITESRALTCFGANDGAISTIATGGTAPYNYNWSSLTDPSLDFSEANNLSNLAPGEYQILVTDANNCEDQKFLPIPEPQAMIIDSASLDETCFANEDGTASVSVNPNFNNLNFLWSNDARTATIDNLANGLYTVSVTNEAGCEEVRQLEVASAPEIILNEETITPISCNGKNDGTATVLATGGSGNLSFQWDDAQNQTTATATQLIAQDYEVIVTDEVGCRERLRVIIPEVPTITIDTLIESISCFGANDGAISTIATGGTAPYNYSWSSLTDPTLDFNEENNLSNLSPGAYRILITDANNCADQKILSIPAPQAMIIDSASLDETCFAKEDGTASVNVSPSFNNLNFLWNNGARTATINNLANGLYTVSVTNEVGCEEIRQFVIEAAPEIILEEETITPASCNGRNDGIANILATGGSGNLSFQWDDVQNQTTATATQLIADNYGVIVTDEAGCTNRLTITIPEIPAITFDTLIRQIGCFGEENGAISLGIDGGTPNYDFSWQDNQQIKTANRANLGAGDYQLMVSDANNCTAILDFTIADKAPINLITNQTPASCNAADGIIIIGVIEGNSAYTFSWADDANRRTAIANNLTKGDYVVTVFDAEGCSATNTITLAEKEGISLAASTTPVVCTDELGSATVVATGGSGDYIYRWNDPMAQENPTAQNLSAGDYVILVQDNNGCEKTMSVTVSDNAIPVNIGFEQKAISCFGANDGQVTALINSPSTNLSYQWSSGETTISLTNIPANTYQLIVTDENDCTHREAVTITEPEELFAETILDPITCPGRGDGVLTILPMGGTSPYFFSKDSRRFSNKNEFFNLAPGQYEPAIKDANNCTVPIPPIEVEEALLLSITIENLELKAAIPQTITPIINNGNGDLTYIWSGNNLIDLSCIDCATPTITPTNSQLYKLNVADENGCKAETTIRVLVEKNRKIYVPTGFTPNGDGSNDRLTVHGIEGTEILSFKIFDRWGELVFVSDAFEANDLSAGWDGYYRSKPMNTNVFAWIVEARFSDGALVLEKGHSTLIR